METWLLLQVWMLCEASDPLRNQRGPSQPEHKSLTIAHCRTGHLCGTFNCCQAVPKCHHHWSQSIQLFWEATTSHPTQAGHSQVRKALPRTYSSCLRSVTLTFRTRPEFTHISPAVTLPLSKLTLCFLDDPHCPQTPCLYPLPA